MNKIPALVASRAAAQTLAFAFLSVMLAGCVVAPYDPGPPAPVAAYGPCCYAYPEYPGYYGPGYVSINGYYGEHYHGGGWWRR